MNRPFTVIILFALCACFASAQNKYLPIIEEGKRWTGKKWGMNVVTGVYETLYDFTVSVGAKKIKNDTVATTIHIEYTHIAYDQSSSSWDFYAYEDDGKLYMYDDSYGHFSLVLDYNYTAGDEISRPYYEPDHHFTVKQDETINVMGTERRVLNVSYVDGARPNYWIEGIGAYQNSCYHFITTFPITGTGYFELWITGCYKDGECIFSEDWLKEYSGVREVGVDVPAAKSERQQIYDVYGRRVTNPQRGSIYIVNGRKVVWQN